MTIVYLTQGLFNRSGMERIITAKLNRLVAYGHKVVVITTDQNGRPCPFELDRQIEHLDLAINYEETARLPLMKKLLSWFPQRLDHKRQLQHQLFCIRPDITVSTFGHEYQLLAFLRYTGKRVAELHFFKGFRRVDNCAGFRQILYRLRQMRDEYIARCYDRIVLLTDEDQQAWRNAHLCNIEVIPNFIEQLPDVVCNNTSTTVLSVGRLAPQKGFDRLIDAWAIVYLTHPAWTLHIVGEGELREDLQRRIDRLGLSRSILLCGATDNMESYYLSSSLYVQSSRFEGLPMVMIEAMSYGMPVVSFDAPCGPKDLIVDGENGRLIPDGDIESLARAIGEMIENRVDALRMGEAARQSIHESYLAQGVMPRWNKLFEKLLNT